MAQLQWFRALYASAALGLGAFVAANDHASARPQSERVESAVASSRPVGSCTVRGIVRRDGRPLARVDLRLELGDSVTDARATTQEDGSFVVAGLPPRRIRVRVADGSHGRGDVSYTLVVSIPAATEHRLDVDLPSSGAIAGHVIRRSDGRPLENLRIWLDSKAPWSRNESPSTDSADTWTDSQGRFSIEGLGVGTYALRVGSFECPVLKASNPPLVPRVCAPLAIVEGIVLPLEVAMEPGCTVIAELRDEEGTPVVGESVSLPVPDGRLANFIHPTFGARSAVTDVNGIATIRDVDPGRYVAKAGRRGSCAAISEEFSASNDRPARIRLRYPKGVSVRVHGVGPDREAVGILSLRFDDPRGHIVHADARPNLPTPWMDVTVPPGMYSVRASALGYEYTPSEVIVTEEPSRSVTVTMRKAPAQAPAK